MVKSRSGSAPHLVKVSNSQYLCDGQCPQFKSINICSHVVAAAECNGDLLSFVNWFCTKRSRGTPNLMKMLSMEYHQELVTKVVNHHKRRLN